MEEAAGERPATATVRLQRSDMTVTVRCADLVETSEARAARDAARLGARDARGAVADGVVSFVRGLLSRLRRWRVRAVLQTALLCNDKCGAAHLHLYACVDAASAAHFFRLCSAR